MTLQLSCPKCGRKITVLPQFVGRQIHCNYCQTLISVTAPRTSPAADFSSLPSARPADPSQAPSRPQKSPPPPDRSNVPIVIATIAVCAGAIIAFGVVATVQLGDGRSFVLHADADPNSPESLPESAEVQVPRTRFEAEEGYSFEVPRGFVPLDRSPRKLGEVCYTFRSETDAAAGCMLCVSPDRNSSRESQLPVVFASPQANPSAPVSEINGIYYLERDRTEILEIDGLPALTYRIKFQSRLRGQNISTIGWFLHAMDEGQVVTIRIITSEDTSVLPPRDWYESITSLRRKK